MQPPEPSERAKKSRIRQQASCSACHTRKQKCDQQIPCDRCLKRGVGHLCFRAGPTALATDSAFPPPPSHQPAVLAYSRPRTDVYAVSAAPDATTLSNRVAALEQALRSIIESEGASREAIIEDLREKSASELPDSNGAEEAAVTALGQLAQGITYDGSSQFHGPGSVADFISSTFDEPGRMAPVTKSFFIFGAAVAHVLEAFPSRELCEYLTKLFYAPHVVPTLRFTVTYEPIFTRTLSALLDFKDLAEARDLNPLPTSLSFISLASITLATALQFLPDTSVSFVTQHCPNIRQLEIDLVRQAKVALDQSESDETADVWRVEAALLHGLYLKNCGRPSSNYHLISQAIRIAQGLGMHREGNWGLSPYDAEIRRRLWARLLTYDKWSNLAFGRPYVIHERHVDTALPANIDLETIDPMSLDPIPSKPLTEPTNQLSSIIEIELANIAGRMMDRVFSAAPHTYADVLACDADFVAFEERIPACLRAPSFELTQQHPYLPAEMNILTMQIYWARTVLHRPYLLRPIQKPDHFARSRSIAVSLSQKLISMQRDVQVSLTNAQKRFFLFCFHVFDPACNLAMAILQQPHLAESLDPWIMEARAVLCNMGPPGARNLVATEGILCLDALRRKISQVVSPTTRMAPLASVPNGPTPIPYLGLSTSISGSGDALMALDPFPTDIPTTSSPGSSASPLVTYSPENGPDSATPDPVFSFRDSSTSGAWLSASDVADMSWPLGIDALQTLNGAAQWGAMLQDLGISVQE